MCEEREDWEYCTNLIIENMKWFRPSKHGKWVLKYMGTMRTTDMKEADWDLIFKSETIPNVVKLNPRLLKYAIVFC